MRHYTCFAIVLGILTLQTRPIVASCPFGCTCNDARQWVVCRGSAITSVPKDLPITTVNFALVETNVAEIPVNFFANLSNLKGIEIRKNYNLRTLPRGIFNHTSLKEVTFIELGFQNLTLPENLFNNLPKLRQIKLNKAGLHELPANTFRNLPSLDWLEVEQNSLTTLPENLFVDIMVKETFTYMTFERNKMRSLPDNVFKPISDKLESLLLATNEFKILPINALRVFGKQLTEIKVHRNPTVCNCSLAEFAVWAKDIIHAGGVTCNGRDTPLSKINLTHCESPTTMLPSTTPIQTTTRSPTTMEKATRQATTTELPPTKKEPTTTKLPSTTKQSSTADSSLPSTTISTLKTSTADSAPTQSTEQFPPAQKATKKTSTVSILVSTSTKTSDESDTLGDTKTQDTSNENEARKTVIIAVSVTAVASVVLLAIILCLFHTGILSSRCGRFRESKVVIYDAEGNILVTEKQGVA